MARKPNYRNSLRRDECEKSALFKSLRPIFLSLRPFSPQAGNCANLVLSSAFEQNKEISSLRNPAKFESATGSRKGSANVLSRAVTMKPFSCRPLILCVYTM